MQSRHGPGNISLEYIFLEIKFYSYSQDIDLRSEVRHTVKTWSWKYFSSEYIYSRNKNLFLQSRHVHEVGGPTCSQDMDLGIFMLNIFF